MAVKLFQLDDDYADIFLNNGLDSFESVWAANAEIVEIPNFCRGGNSNVGLLRLPVHDGEEQNFYLKRQTNYNYRTLFHPFKGVPLAIREWENIQKLNDVGIKTMDVVCVGRIRNGDDRGILVTRALDSYQTIEEWLSQSRGDQQRGEAMVALGRLVGQMHLAGFRHSCLYPKHVFIDSGNHSNIRLIDLEKAKPIFSKKGGFGDITKLFKRTSQLIVEDKQQFLAGYVAESPVSSLSPLAQKKFLAEMIAVEYA